LERDEKPRQGRLSAHIFNNWSRMPSIADQLKPEDAFTDHVGARFLLTYEQSVARFPANADLLPFGIGSRNGHTS
jgi:hypothetical protein